METRRFGRTGYQTSVLAYGAAALGSVDQQTADASIAYALDVGINHFDTAASYGDSELRMGPWMPRIRDQIFLATKTEHRDAESAWAQLNDSLERLQTDHVDLLQLHAVCDTDALDAALAPGGAIEAFERARDEGLTRWIGITGHTHRAPSVHFEALRRYDFDSVLTPLNPVLFRDADYARDYEELAALVVERDVALRTIKTAARRRWADGEQDMSTWYMPFTEQRHLTAAVAWVLNGHPEVAGIATAGETRLLERMVRAEHDRHAFTPDQAWAELADVEDYASPFVGSWG